MSYSLANGQLAASAASILAGTAAQQTGFVSVSCHNTSGVNTETVVLTVQRAGGTARRVGRAILAPNESCILNGLSLDPSDTLLGTTTDATTVDYDIIGAPLAPRTLTVYDAQGSPKNNPNITTTTSGQIFPGIFPKNTLDGADFGVNPWQRGTTFTAIANTLTYTADRWFAVGGASSSISVSQQAQTDVAGFANSLRWGRGGGTNTATIKLGQVCETADCVRFQGQQVTLSFWAKAGAQFSAAVGVTVQLFSGTGTNDSAANMVAGSWAGSTTPISATQALTTSPVRYSFTATIPAGCTQIGVLFSYAPTGTNNTTDTVDFYGVQLELGSQASPFEHRDIEVELALCQRYYTRFTEISGATFAIGAPAVGANLQTYSLWLPTPMRAAPTVTWTAGTFKLIIDGAANAAPTTPSPGAAHSLTVITLTTANTLTAAAHSVALVGAGTTGFIDASSDF